MLNKAQAIPNLNVKVTPNQPVNPGQSTFLPFPLSNRRFLISDFVSGIRQPMSGYPQQDNSANPAQTFTFASNQTLPNRPPNQQPQLGAAPQSRPPPQLQNALAANNAAALKTASIARNQPILTARVQTTPGSTSNVPGAAPVTPKINIFVSNSPAPGAESDSSVSLANSSGVATPLDRKPVEAAQNTNLAAALRGGPDQAQIQKVLLLFSFCLWNLF